MEVARREGVDEATEEEERMFVRACSTTRWTQYSASVTSCSGSKREPEHDEKLALDCVDLAVEQGLSNIGSS